jgi:hypothetical protein
MRLTVIASPSAPHQLRHQEMMGQGLKKIGIEPVPIISTYANSVKTELVACWGWRLGKQLRDKGHEVLVMERAYLGDRFNWTSLAWNGLNGRGEFPPAPDDMGKRFADNFSMKPWRQTSGDYVLILGQVPGDASLQGRNLMPWYESIAVLAKDAYGLPVYFRQHPGCAKRGVNQMPRHTLKSVGSLEEALAGAHVTVTFNSNSGVDSVIAGVPNLTLDQGSMAWEVSGHQVGDYVTPDRDSWAHSLAWKQWRLEEISSGFALQHLLKSRLCPKL